MKLTFFFSSSFSSFFFLTDEIKNQSFIIVRLQKENLLNKNQMQQQCEARIQELEKQHALKMVELEQAKLNDWERAHRSAAELSLKENSKYIQDTKLLKMKIIELEKEILTLKKQLMQEKETLQTITIQLSTTRKTHDTAINELKLMLNAANERCKSQEEHTKAIEILHLTNMDKMKEMQEKMNEKINALEKKLNKEQETTTSLRSELAVTKNELALEKSRNKTVSMTQSNLIKEYELKIITLEKQIIKWKLKEKEFKEIETKLKSLQTLIDRNTKEYKQAKMKVTNLNILLNDTGKY